MQPASPETVLGDFDDAEFVHFGKTTRFRRDEKGLARAADLVLKKCGRAVRLAELRENLAARKRGAKDEQLPNQPGAAVVASRRGRRTAPLPTTAPPRRRGAPAAGTPAPVESATWSFDCSCGVSGTNFDDGKAMWECTACKTWQHAACAGGAEDAEEAIAHAAACGAWGLDWDAEEAVARAAARGLD